MLAARQHCSAPGRCDISPDISFFHAGIVQRSEVRFMNQESFNKNLMLSVFRAFKDGDLEPLFACLSDDVVWKSTAPPEFFRFGGTHYGRAGMKEFTALLL